jgi:hypothetical protein
MTDTQYYTLIAVPLIGILMNAALYICLAGRINRAIENLSPRA